MKYYLILLLVLITNVTLGAPKTKFDQQVESTIGFLGPKFDFYEDDKVNYITLEAPSVLGVNYTITFPEITGTLLTHNSTATLTGKTIVVNDNTITTAAVGNLGSTELNDALAELQGDIDGLDTDLGTVSGDLSTHISDTTGAHAAVAISNTTSGNLTSTNVQSSLEELQGDIDGVRTDLGDTTLDLSNHLSDFDNPHAVDAEQIGLENVDNTSDVDKPISDATQTELDSINTAVGGIATDISNHVGSTTQHGATGAVVGTTNTQTLTNKTLTTPVIDVVSLTEQSSAPSSPSSGTKKFYAKNDGKLYTKDNLGNEVEVGSGGSGGINYIKNPNAESSITGWSAYSDAAGTEPVDGTGGTPTISFYRNTPSTIINPANFQIGKGLSNSQGNGVSYDFSIDPIMAEQRIAQSISFRYKYLNDFVAGTSSDIKIFIYDVTNSTLITPAYNYIDGSGIFQTSFTPSSSTSYRLIAHVSTTSALLWYFDFGAVTVGPLENQFIKADSDEYACTPTHNWGGNATLVTMCSKQGEFLTMRGIITTSGAVSAAHLTIVPPSGLVINLTKLPLASTNGSGQPVGMALSKDASVASSSGNQGEGYISTSGGNGIFFYNSTISGSYTVGNQVSNTQPFTWAASDNFYFKVTVPIVGWTSGNSAVGTWAQKSPSEVIYTTSSSTSVPNNGTLTIINFNSRTEDLLSEVTTGASWKHRPRQPGYYDVKSYVQTDSAAWVSTNYMVLQIYKNGSFYETLDLFRHSAANTDTFGLTGSGTVYLNGTTDYIDIRMAHNRTSGSATTSTTSRVNISFNASASAFINIPKMITFKAIIDNAGNVTKEGCTFGQSCDWINGSCAVSGTSIFTCQLNAVTSGKTPECTGSVNHDVTGADRVFQAGFANTNGTQIQYITNGNGSVSPYRVNIFCSIDNL